jgi:glycerol-3-phosphate O-acyltransferase
MLEELPYSDRVTLTPMNPAGIIAYGEQMGWIQRVQHPLGDVLTVSAEQAVMLSYFRNNVLHLNAAAAWVACCFLNNRRMSRASVLRLGGSSIRSSRASCSCRGTTMASARSCRHHRFLRTPRPARIQRRWPRAGTQRRSGRRRISAEGDRAQPDPGLRALLHHHCRAGEERSAHADRRRTRNACTLTAQRLSLLNELSAPEFFDKALFRGFIQKLRERRVVWTDDAGKLDYDVALEWFAMILSREVRHSILKITPGGNDPVDAKPPCRSRQACWPEPTMIALDPPAPITIATSLPNIINTNIARRIDTGNGRQRAASRLAAAS